ncbi:hypothetical protein [Streptomyces sp. SS8]
MHVPRDFLAALTKAPPERVGEGWADNHVYIQSNLMEPAVAAAGMVAAAVADPLVPLMWRRSLLLVLDCLCTGEQDGVAAACLQAVRGCSWALYEEIASGRSVSAAGYAFELLSLMPEEKERLKFFQERHWEDLPWDLRPGRMDLDAVDW